MTKANKEEHPNKPVNDGGFSLEATLKPLTDKLPTFPVNLKEKVVDAVRDIDYMDMNHDAKRDIAQAAPFVSVGVPHLVGLLECIDIPKLEQILLHSPWVTDPAKATEHFAALKKLHEEAKALKALS